MTRWGVPAAARRVVAPYGAGIRLQRRGESRNDRVGSACTGRMISAPTSGAGQGNMMEE